MAHVDIFIYLNLITFIFFFFLKVYLFIEIVVLSSIFISNFEQILNYWYNKFFFLTVFDIFLKKYKIYIKNISYLLK